MRNTIAATALFLAMWSYEAKADDLKTIVQGNSEIYCLAETIFRETRGTGVQEKIMVGNVVMNRTETSGFADTLCGVMKQKGQFPWVNVFSKAERMKTIKRDREEFDESYVIASYIISGSIDDPTNGALFFHARDGKKRSWTNGLRKVKTTKHHIYYKKKGSA